MGKTAEKVLLISDFTIENFANCLQNDNDFPLVHCSAAPYGQVTQILIDEDADCWKEKPDHAIIWTRPEHQIEAFNKLLRYEKISIKNVLDQVEVFGNYLLEAALRTKCIFVPLWTLPAFRRGLGFLDMKHNLGLANVLMTMNLKLSKSVNKASNIFILNTQKWLEHIGHKAFNPSFWYMGKIAFSNEVFIEATKDIKAALAGIKGKTKK